MRLKKLRIEREEWGQHKDQLRGKIEFSGELGEITLVLNDDQLNRIFQVCADSLVSTAQEAGSLMTSALIEQSAPALEQA